MAKEVEMIVDLFGELVPAVDPISPNESDYQRFKRVNHYRRSEDKERRCKVCRYCYQKRGYNHNYTKCHLIGCSSSPATDIAQRNVCDKFDRRPEQQKMKECLI